MHHLKLRACAGPMRGAARRGEAPLVHRINLHLFLQAGMIRVLLLFELTNKCGICRTGPRTYICSPYAESNQCHWGSGGLKITSEKTTATTVVLLVEANSSWLRRWIGGINAFFQIRRELRTVFPIFLLLSRRKVPRVGTRDIYALPG